MKITIDLADTQFQATVAAAVKEKLHALAADELEKQMKAAVDCVALTLDRRFEAVIKRIVSEGLEMNDYNSRETLRRQLRQQADRSIREIVIEQFNIIFPRRSGEAETGK